MNYLNVANTQSKPRLPRYLKGSSEYDHEISESLMRKCENFQFDYRKHTDLDWVVYGCGEDSAVIGLISKNKYSFGEEVIEIAVIQAQDEKFDIWRRDSGDNCLVLFNWQWAKQFIQREIYYATSPPPFDWIFDQHQVHWKRKMLFATGDTQEFIRSVQAANHHFRDLNVDLQGSVSDQTFIFEFTKNEDNEPAIQVMRKHVNGNSTILQVIFANENYTIYKEDAEEMENEEQNVDTLPTKENVKDYIEQYITQNYPDTSGHNVMGQHMTSWLAMFKIVEHMSVLCQSK